MEPGIYNDIDSEQYHAIDAVSSTRLKDLKESPGHCKFWMENKRTSSDEMAKGTALHTALLEPESFDRIYVIEPSVKKYGKANLEIWAEWEQKLKPGQIGIKEQTRDEVLQARDDVLQHPLVSSMISKATCKEMTIIWIDAETGLLCKARPDLYIAPVNLFADIKYTHTASEYGFQATIYDFGYHIQLTHYEAGFRAHGIEIAERVLIPIEKKRPRRIDTFCPNEVMQSESKLAYRELMKLYAECVASDDWPLNKVGFKQIGLPNYAIKNR